MIQALDLVLKKVLESELHSLDIEIRIHFFGSNRKFTVANIYEILSVQIDAEFVVLCNKKLKL